MKILVCAYDPGGISALLPVCEELEKRGHEIVLHSVGEGVNRFNSNGIECYEIPNVLLDNSELLETWLMDNEYDEVLTGTSSYNNLERLLWRASKNVGIKSYAILDYWFNLSIRFHFNPTLTIDYKYEIESLPDYIYVVDEYVFNGLCSLGIKRDSIIISGHPRLYNFYHDRKEVKEQNNMLSGKRIILYSEQINEIYNAIEQWGFDEYTVIEIIFDAIKRSSHKYELIIKSHPKQHLDVKKIREINKEYKIKYRITRDQVDLNRNDIVVGTFTMAMVEALVKGYKVINVIPSKNAIKYSVVSAKGLLVPAKDTIEVIDRFNLLEKIDIKHAFYLDKNPCIVIASKMEADYEYISN